MHEACASSAHKGVCLTVTCCQAEKVHIGSTNEYQHQHFFACVGCLLGLYYRLHAQFVWWKVGVSLDLAGENSLSFWYRERERERERWVTKKRFVSGANAWTKWQRVDQQNIGQRNKADHQLCLGFQIHCNALDLLIWNRQKGIQKDSLAAGLLWF